MAEQKKQEQDTNQLLKVRREKLAELQAKETLKHVSKNWKQFLRMQKL